jgi:hypothetical protein
MVPPRFVGRAVERAELAQLLERTRGVRSGGVALVVGEPGVGKTALVQAVVEASGLSALWAAGREQGGAPPLWLWEQVARAARARGLSLAAEATPARDGAATTGRGLDRFQRFDAMTCALLDLAATEPFVVVLDDLQWADADSLALLEFLGAELRHCALSVVATVRAGDLEPLPRAELVLALRGLLRADLGELVRTLVDDEPSDDLLDSVANATGGNPFFVGEVARLLRSSGDAVDARQWRGVLPDGVRAVLGRRFARLAQATHEALAAAAILGEEIDATLLAGVMELPREDVYERLAPAVAAGLLRDRGDGRFAFAHALVREAAQADLGAGARRALHERAAMLLEAIAGDRTAGEIALHCLAAGDTERGAAWAERAGDIAFSAAMYADAAEWYGRVRVTRPDADAGLIVRHADALARGGQSDVAGGVYAEAARCARRTGDDDAFARAALGSGSIGGGFEVRLLDRTQLALLEEALDRLGPSDSPLTALVEARLSVASTLEATHERRVALADDAVAMARRLDDPGALAYALSAWCDAHAGPRDVDARLHATDEMLAAALRSGDPELELLARRFRIVAFMERGEVTLVRNEVEAFARLADGLRQPEFRWYGRLVDGMLALLAGDLDTAQRLGEEASALGRTARSANAHMLVDGGLLPIIGRERGDDDWLERLRAVNLQHHEASRGSDMYELFTAGYGGDPAALRACIAETPSPDAFADVDDGLFIQVTALYADAVAAAGDVARGRALYDALLPFADRFVLDGTAAVCYGPVAATLGRLAALLGDVDAARGWYDQAAVRLRAIGAPRLLARVDTERAALGAAAPHDAAQPTRGTFAREGDVWLVAFTGAEARIRHSKGMLDLATLLERPGRDVHVLDLVAASDGHDARRAGAVDATTGATLDAAARRAYEQRIRDLTEEIEAAEANHDDARAAKLDDERAALIGELAAAFGLGGRTRASGSDVERARKAVGMRIRDAIQRIDRSLPPLGHHLRHAVQTGTFCSYRPEHTVDWHRQP